MEKESMSGFSTNPPIHQPPTHHGTIWSSGGGVQSAAIAALIVNGDLPHLDLAAISDTEREASATWVYHNTVIAPALTAVGVTLQRVYKSTYATVDLYSNNGTLLIPVHTSTGKFPTYCSTEWKRRVIRWWARAVRLDIKTWVVWLGISIDEPRRVKPTDTPWLTRYPLIEHQMSRADCVKLIASMGWPSAPRSSCWMCPNHTIQEWNRLQQEAPEDFAAAIRFENTIREQDDEIWLTRTHRPLSEWVGDGPPDLFTGLCDSGYCFI